MRAILSDIHGNLAALEAVLADLAAHGADEIYCLGDLVGYGPNPVECLEIAMQWDLVLQGNHDHAMIHGGYGFSGVAAQSIWWSRHQVGIEGTSSARFRRMQFLEGLVPTKKRTGVWYMHATPRDPLFEYLRPADIADREKMQRTIGPMPQLGFCGHTHIPGVFQQHFQSWSYIGLPHCELYRVPEHGRVLVNVGSVGQPRDGDWRACYVLYNDRDIYFRRVEYDVDRTIDAIHRIPELNNFLGDRLQVGL